MKTVEEKAKAYDEALERAKKLQETCDSTTVVGWCEYIFQELRESKDEKIKKEIINYFAKGKEYLSLCSIGKDDILAWLEKQGNCEYIRKDWLEHIKQSWYKEGFIDGKYTPKELTINDAATLNELIDFLENGTVKLQHDLTLYANWLKTQFSQIEKQGEQKPTLRERYKNIAKSEWFKKTHEGMSVSDDDNEQKPWSEEDELMFISTIQGIEMTNGAAQLKIDWLKSLKERIGG